VKVAKALLMNVDGTKAEELHSPKGVKTEPEFCMGGRAVVFRIQRSERYATHGTHLTTLDGRTVERIPETD